MNVNVFPQDCRVFDRTYRGVDFAACRLKAAVLTNCEGNLVDVPILNVRHLTNVQLAGATKKPSKNARGVRLAARLLLVHLAHLPVVLDSRSLLTSHRDGRNDSRRGDDGDDRSELHFGGGVGRWLVVVEASVSSW